MTEPKRPYPDGVPVAPDTTMPPRKFVRWGATADSPPTDIHDDPDKTRAYRAGLAAGRAEAAAECDRLRDERDRARDVRDGDWRCLCGDLNREHEACCFRCGGGDPREEPAPPFFTEQQERALDRCEAFDAEKPETDT